MTGIGLVKQWHPALVHFPIALLTVEALFLLMYFRTQKPEYERFSFWLLILASLSLVPVVLTGLSDSGLDLGPGIPIILGLQDRIKNALRFESTISCHVALALPVILLTLVRWVWRWRARSQSVSGWQGRSMLILTLLVAMLMYAAAYVGGTVSHS
jgi:uncharacterized membrane protein